MRELVRSNTTRWNSVFKELQRLLSLKPAFEYFLECELASTAKTGRTTKSANNTTHKALHDNKLSSDDWDILAHYVELLEPCYDATMDLQGQQGDDKPCALFHVQVDIECIVESLTAAYDRYKQAPNDSIEGQWHFATQIRLALDKAEEYYAKLDQSPAYLASTVLHPIYTWKFIEQQWSNKKAWIRSGKIAITDLWRTEYKRQDAAIASPVKQRRWRHEPSKMEEHRMRGLQQAHMTSHKVVNGDELERWLKEQLTTESATNPLEWWRVTGSKHYPQLTQMAVDLLSIPAMSDEPERLFSRLGLIITPRRNHLKQDAVQAIACLHSWDRNGLIDMRKSPDDA